MIDLNISSIENFIIHQLEDSLMISRRELMLETKFILQQALGVSSLDLVMNKTTLISGTQFKKIKTLVKKRKEGQPLAYIFGAWDFYGETFFVNRHTLTPRPDTELLIDIIIERFHKELPLKILDLGTGSGIIGITLSNHYKNSKVFLSDISKDALKVAKKNALKFNQKLNFIESNWFERIEDFNFDIVISNPPYVSKNDARLFSPEIKHEPDLALFSEDYGLKDIKLICTQVEKFLVTNGLLIIEHGFNQASKVKKIFEKNKLKNITQYKDINQKYRVTLGSK